MKKLLSLFMLMGFYAIGYSQIKITALKAPAYIGDSVAVPDKVYSSKVFPNGMALLNLGARYPHPLLVVFIPPEAKTKFSYKPEEYFKGKRILVTGKLIKNIGQAQIVIYDPKQISELSGAAEEYWNQLKEGRRIVESEKLNSG